MNHPISTLIFSTDSVRDDRKNRQIRRAADSLPVWMYKWFQWVPDFKRLRESFQWFQKLKLIINSIDSVYLHAYHSRNETNPDDVNKRKTARISRLFYYVPEVLNVRVNESKKKISFF